MATLEECTAALARLAEQLGGVDAETRSKHVLNRSLACRVSDLDVTFRAELRDGGLHDIRQGQADGAHITLRVKSDDLVALTDGRLGFAGAWATGKVKVDASLTDLLRLRTLL
jgi:predicted lipid carrier protein YhbT